MLNGRPVQNQGVHISLYNPVFVEFQAMVNDLMVPITAKDLENTVDFCKVSAEIYLSDTERMVTSKTLLRRILGVDIADALTPSDASAGGIIASKVCGHPLQLCRAIFEWRNEIGIGNCDPAIQGEYSFRNYWSQNDVSPNYSVCE